MSYRQISRVLAILLLIVSGFMATPILVAWYYGEVELLWCFLAPVGVTVLGSALLLILSKGDGGELSIRDGFLLVALSWIVVSIVGAVPLYLSGSFETFVDAFFETVSGFTTTGASILTDIESLPHSVLFWRSLTHWLGGMGIVVLTVAIFPILGIGGLQLIKAEAPGPTVDKITPKITETAKILWITYLSLSAAETILLLLGGLDLFDSLTHMFGTMATGGFSPKNASVGHFDSAYIEGVVTVFMVLAGINFLMYYKFFLNGRETVFINSELKAYLGIFVGGTVVVTLVQFLGDVYSTVGESLRYASFQVASILTTTGYVSTDYELWMPAAQAVLFVLMFVGGSSGSTAGGVKVVRIVALLKQAFTEMKYLLHPRGVFATHMSGNVLRKNVVYAIGGFVVLYAALLLLTTFVVALAGSDLTTSFSTALATIGNIGPGFGEIGPTENYAAYPQWLKLYLSAMMIIGRLEIFTILVLLTPGFWRR